MTDNPGSYGVRKVLIGAVVLSGAVIAAIAVGYVNQVKPLNLAQTEPVSGADMDDMDGGFAGPACTR